MNGSGDGEIIAPGVKLNEYVTNHTYAANGSYLLSMEDPNRNPGILNIPQSVDVPFYIESMLIVGNTSSLNNSIFTLAPNILTAVQNQVFVHTVAAWDPDEDNLTFELVSCRGAQGTEIPGYTLPNGLSISELSGELTWHVPTQVGEYNFAVKIKEWRNGVLVGYSTYDFQVDVIEGPDDGGGFLVYDGWPTDQSGNPAMVVDANEQVEFDIGYFRYGADVELDLITESAVTSAASFSEYFTASDSVASTFNWTPSISDKRCAPYILAFRGTDTITGQVFYHDTTLLIYVWDTIDSAFVANCENSVSIFEFTQASRNLNVFPNPVKDVLNVTFEFLEVESFEILDHSGRNVSAVFEQLSRSEEFLSVDVSKLKNGIYTAAINSNSGTKHAKFVKVK